MSHKHTNGPEHDFEPVRGLPEMLPVDEHIVWQGAPTARGVMRHVLRGRWIASYFVLLIGWTLITGFYDGRSVGQILFSGAAVTILSAIGIVLLELFAWGVQKTTVYTITNKRLVMRIGVALSVTFNIPFTQIVSANVRKRDDGSGDIALETTEGNGLNWFWFWPHLQGHIFAPVRPRLTAIKDVDHVSVKLTEQLQAFAARRHEAISQGSDVPLSTVVQPATMSVAAE